MNPLIQSKNTTILPVLIALTLGCFGAFAASASRLPRRLFNERKHRPS
jgi:hypothetical protein